MENPGAYGAWLERALPDPFVSRRTSLGLDGDTSRAKLVVGPRQAGKTTLVWAVLRSVDPLQVLFVSAEEPLVRVWMRSATEVHADITEQFPSTRLLFIDEAQHLDDAGLLVKGLVDRHPRYEVVVTGSSSYHLRARTRESLAGRASRRLLLPFSLAEAVGPPGPVPAVHAERQAAALRRQLVYGGYPQVWLSDDPAPILDELVEAFVLRDASDLFRIERPEAFRRLLGLLAGQVGQMVNYSEWASIVGVDSTTVRRWIGLLEESWVVKQLRPFAGGRRREITSAGRVHFYDMGLRNALLGAYDEATSTRPDVGALVEGWVFGELVKSAPRGWSLGYWRTKGGAELDFVLVRGDAVIGVEVKAGLPRPSRSVRSFAKAYHPRAVLLVGGGGSVERMHLEGVPLVAVPHARVAEVVAELTE